MAAGVDVTAAGAVATCVATVGAIAAGVAAAGAAGAAAAGFTAAGVAVAGFAVAVAVTVTVGMDKRTLGMGTPVGVFGTDAAVPVVVEGSA